MMKLWRSLSLCFAAATLLGSFGGCADYEPNEDLDMVEDALVVSGVDVTVGLSSEWGAGYCADVVLRNRSNASVSSWTVVVELNQSQLSNLWNGTHTTSGSRITVRPLSWNSSIAPGASATFGFCANATGSNYRPAIASATINGGGSSGSGGSTGSGGGTATGGSTSSGGTSGCTGGQSLCSGQCVNTSISSQHCGSCGNSCGTGRSCVSGSCQCSSGTTLCGSQCVNTSTSTSNCGACGRSCSSGQTCSAGVCTGGSTQVPQPPAEFRQTIDLTWKEMTGGFQGLTGARNVSSGVQNFRNTILDQLFASDGTLRYCVRWDSSGTVSPAVRDQIQPALQRNMDQWFSKLGGYDRWPHAQPPRVRVTGWAVRNRNQLQWSDNSVPIYVNDIRENAPQCAQVCGRFFNRQDGFRYPNCPGGFDNHYDMSLWLTDGFGGGVGGDWGQRLGTSGFLNSLGTTNGILIHEIGHGFGFPDYYNWHIWAPGVPSPNSVMVAGRARIVTDWDSWMMRHTWTQLKGRLL